MAAKRHLWNASCQSAKDNGFRGRREYIILTDFENDIRLYLYRNACKKLSVSKFLDNMWISSLLPLEKYTIIWGICSSFGQIWDFRQAACSKSRCMSAKKLFKTVIWGANWSAICANDAEYCGKVIHYKHWLYRDCVWRFVLPNQRALSPVSSLHQVRLGNTPILHLLFISSRPLYHVCLHHLQHFRSTAVPSLCSFCSVFIDFCACVLLPFGQHMSQN